jgi:transcriptional regulator with XRE-family HTH domain
MTSLGDLTLGERVAELRRRRGMSQRDLGAEVGRSESWVSQVERDVLPVDRSSVLQALADGLGVSVRDLRSDEVEAEVPSAESRGVTLSALRLALTGPPALTTVLGTSDDHQIDVAELRTRVDDGWELTHQSRFDALGTQLPPLLADLERASRVGNARERSEASRLLASAYLAAAAAFARRDEADAAWVAADRAGRSAESVGDPLGSVASAFRMGHAFITLRRLDQAERVAAEAIHALSPLAERHDCPPETLSLYGAMHLILSVVYAREGHRQATRRTLDQARQIAARVGPGRNDYDTEFGPTNVELHAVAAAVDLGDAGEALDLARQIDAAGLSPERQSRLHLDLARAHLQRRHLGEAVAALLDAERAAPEQVQTHTFARDTARELISLTGRRATPELIELARRIGAT